MPSVTVYEGNFDKALRKFKKKVSNSGILEEVKDRQHYEKPSTIRKRKLAAAKARQKKKSRTEQPPRNF